MAAVIYDFFIGWTTVPALCPDDRAIHALYRTFPDKNEISARTASMRLGGISTPGCNHRQSLRPDFPQRCGMKLFRSCLVQPFSYVARRSALRAESQLSMRVETQMEAANHVAFTDRLRAFVAAFCPPTSLHA